jgi:CRP-like cAMP-binding protein
MAELLTPMRLLLHRLAAGVELSRDHIDALHGVGGRMKSFVRGQRLDDDDETIWLIAEGWAFRQKTFLDGRRNIMSLMLPGELTGKPPVVPVTPEHAVVAATPVEAQAIDRKQFAAVGEDFPALMVALLAEELLQRSLAQEWNAILAIGTAEQRLAYFFYETYIRLHAMGLAADNAFEFRINQQDVADVIGASSVHLNRVLQSLRASGSVEWSDHWITIRRPSQLAQVAMFSKDLERVALEFGIRAVELQRRRLAPESAFVN